MRSDIIERSKRFSDKAKNERLTSPQMVQKTKAVRYSTVGIRKAYCKTDAGEGSTLVCYLDEDAGETEITVNFSIAGGTDLNEAFPYLTDGTLIFVQKFGDDWYCISPLGKMDICE